MAKYAISKEFFPFNHFKPPIGERFLKIAVKFMKVPKFIYRDKSIESKIYKVSSFDGESIQCILIAPKNVTKNTPCLIYIHGGGFVLPAAGYHYKNAVNYAKRVGCCVWFINYRLAPKYKFPTFFEDCYAAADYLYSNADKLGVSVDKIGIGGDSAGSTLSVGVCLMLKERNHPLRLAFQMLPYPFLDMRGESESNKKFTDTPMWNSTLSAKIGPMTNVNKSHPNYVYYSPVEADSFEELPPAYIETAEFDCLHDDGILYANLLCDAGVLVEINQTRGPMHGFDIKQNAPTTKMAVRARIDFMKKILK